jgi:hypothetical protein
MNIVPCRNFHRYVDWEAFLEARSITCSVFSAIEAEKSRSSIVAIQVDSFSLHSILVVTFRCLRVVATVRPRGVLKLSGETASATAFATAESS